MVVHSEIDNKIAALLVYCVYQIAIRKIKLGQSCEMIYLFCSQLTTMQNCIEGLDPERYSVQLRQIYKSFASVLVENYQCQGREDAC